MTYGRSKVVFVIGGSLGLHDSVMKRADELLVLFENDVSTSDDEIDLVGASLSSISDYEG